LNKIYIIQQLNNSVSSKNNSFRIQWVIHFEMTNTNVCETQSTGTKQRKIHSVNGR